MFIVVPVAANGATSCDTLAEFSSKWQSESYCRDRNQTKQYLNPSPSFLLVRTPHIVEKVRSPRLAHTHTQMGFVHKSDSYGYGACKETFQYLLLCWLLAVKPAFPMSPNPCCLGCFFTCVSKVSASHFELPQVTGLEVYLLGAERSQVASLKALTSAVARREHAWLLAARLLLEVLSPFGNPNRWCPCGLSPSQRAWFWFDGSLF